MRKASYRRCTLLRYDYLEACGGMRRKVYMRCNVNACKGFLLQDAAAVVDNGDKDKGGSRNE